MVAPGLYTIINTRTIINADYETFAKGTAKNFSIVF
jgi:hypothetical protein